MKKGNRQAVRRKTTKAVVSRKNKAKKQKGKMVKSIAENASWVELNELRGRAQALFAIPAVLPTILRDENVIKSLGDKLPKIRALVAQVHTDTEQAKVALNNIHGEHEGKRGGGDDPEVMALQLNVGNKYVEWAESFENKVIAGVRDVLALANSELAPEQKIVTGISQIDVEQAHD